MAGAGHDLPRRHRVGGRQDQEGAHDQVAPQRRRPARDAAPEAPRAAARAVQGRGARARPGARPAARHGRSAIRSPGPGLGVRILGEVTRALRRPAAPRRRDLHRRAARGRAGTTRPARRSRCSCRCRSVGVMGDGRTYEHVVALRAVQTTDFMTAHWAHAAARPARRASRTASSTRCAASTASSTTSPASRRRRSSGSEGTR